MPVPSLYPVYLPFLSGHRILVMVQGMLEEACYAFAKPTLPKSLEGDDWGCPESFELTVWTKLFRNQRDRSDPDKVAELGKPLDDVLSTVAQIRHTAVHRIRVTAARIEQYLKEAQWMANLMGADMCSLKLSSFRREATMAIEEFKRNKDVLETRHKQKLKSIAAKRAELDRLERAAIDEMQKNNEEYQAIVGSNLEMAILPPTTVLHSAIASESEDFPATSESECWGADVDSEDVAWSSGTGTILGSSPTEQDD